MEFSGPTFKITDNRDHSKAVPFDSYFVYHRDSEKIFVYCKDIAGLFERFGHPHVADDWRLFIDSSVNSLKVVLLHIGNKQPSVPIAYSTNMRETFENMKLILDVIKYDTYNWKICCDLKVIGLLMGVKGGFSSMQCFLCKWQGRNRERHYTKYRWPSRTEYKIGVDSIVNVPLVPSSHIILPPLHIKLGIAASFVRALEREGSAIQSLRALFPKLSEAKVKAGEFLRFERVFPYSLNQFLNEFVLSGIFTGPQIRKIIGNAAFESTLSAVELRAWKAAVDVLQLFLGNTRAPHYRNIVAQMTSAFAAMGVLMSFKIHFLHNPIT